MSDPATPDIAPNAARVAPMPDDNFGQRLGVALAVSIGVNILILQGAGTLAQSMARVPALFEPITVKVLPPITNVPLDTIASPTPTAAGTPVPVATPAPAATPAPTRPRQVAEAVRRRVTEPVPRPVPTTRRVTQNTPRPVTTPPPTTRNFATRATTAASTAVNTAAAAAAATATRTTSTTAVSRTSRNTANPVEARNTNLNTRTSATAATTAGTTPNLTRSTARALGGGTTTRAVGARSSATQQFSAKAGAAGATQFATSAAAGTPGTAGLNRSATAVGRAGAGVGEARGSVGALNPATVAPEAISTNPGHTRQFRTVAGVASRAVGANSVVTMSAKAAAASTSNFTFQTGGQIRPGTPTARQGGAGTTATSIVAGTPTVIASKGEYAVYAPVPETRGVIGVRGTRSAPIGAAVTNLRAKGNPSDVAGGAAIYASEGNGVGAGTQVRGTVAGRTTSSASGVGGGVSAKSGGAGYVPGVGEGGNGGRGTQVSAAGTGNGAGTRGKALSAGGGAGGSARGGDGGVQGSDIGNGLGGAAKTGGGGGRTVAAGAAGGREGGGVGAKATTAGAAGGASAVNARQTNARAIDVTDEEEALTSDKILSQVPASVSSKPEFDLPDDLRRQKFNGRLEIRVIIEASGSHTEELVKGTGNNEVDRAVLNWLRSWRWTPAKQDGKTVRTSRIQKINLGVS